LTAAADLSHFHTNRCPRSGPINTVEDPLQSVENREAA